MAPCTEPATVDRNVWQMEIAMVWVVMYLTQTVVVLLQEFGMKFYLLHLL